MRRLFVAISMLLAMPLSPARAAFPDPPPAVEVSPEEEEDLLARDIVLRVEDTEEGANTVAILDVAAPPRKVIDSVMDVTARVDEVGSIKSASVYHHEPTAIPEELGVQWEIRVVGKKIVFHTWYEVDRDLGWCTYRLDAEQENDVKSAAGSYQVYENGTGSRLVYRSAAEAGTSVPSWLKRWLVSGSLKDQLKGIRERAEQT
ncbi:MAG: hypothetical protein JRJ84_05970 [Deltaproteobacteria bacterium]|nr:hypothetical protein [Deltaproteobacteria bacterium]